MFNKYFFKDISFWIGILILYLNRDILLHVSVLNPSWVINTILFLGALYLIICSLIKKSSK